jgi:hypothetical protein
MKSPILHSKLFNFIVGAFIQISTVTAYGGEPLMENGLQLRVMMRVAVEQATPEPLGEGPNLRCESGPVNSGFRLKAISEWIPLSATPTLIYTSARGGRDVYGQIEGWRPTGQLAVMVSGTKVTPSPSLVLLDPVDTPSTIVRLTNYCSGDDLYAELRITR